MTCNRHLRNQDRIKFRANSADFIFSEVHIFAYLFFFITKINVTTFSLFLDCITLQAFLTAGERFTHPTWSTDSDLFHRRAANKSWQKVYPWHSWCYDLNSVMLMWTRIASVLPGLVSTHCWEFTAVTFEPCSISWITAYT